MIKQQKRAAIETAVKYCTNEYGAFDKNDVIASLSLSIWLEVVSPKFLNQIWIKHIDDVFVHKPQGMSVREFISELQQQFKHIKTLRNRIAHHEPIYHPNIQKSIDAITLFLKAAAPELLVICRTHFQASQDIKHQIKALLKQQYAKK